MIFPRNKREAAPVEKTAADFYQKTCELLEKAMMDRDEIALRRGGTRIDNARFNELTDDQQERLLQLYASALAANGALSP
jgi:hypothetical protein